MKVHLGCGQRYLDGYVNIDFPLSEHTVQTNSVADRYADITALSFSRGEISEIRLHHVFEHFRRPVACGMIAAWNSWLKEGGTLRIEVPDLRAMAAVIANPIYSDRRRCVAERHLFGSHEADWAAHYEGYSRRILCLLVETFGYKVEKVWRNGWRGTSNIDITAVKVASLTLDECKISASKYFEHFLLDRSDAELRLRDVWVKMFEAQVLKGWAD